MNDTTSTAGSSQAETTLPANVPVAATAAGLPRQSWRMLVLVFVVVAALAWAGVYFLRGIPLTGKGAEVRPAPAASAPAAGQAKPVKALTDEQLDRMVAQVSEQTQREPKNHTAWAMLAHTYEMQGKFPEAVRAYAKLIELVPRDAQLLADYADALAVANGRSFKGEPQALIDRALAADPKNAKALALAATAQMDEKAWDKAQGYWERVQKATQDPALLELAQVGLTQVQALSGKAVAPQKTASGVPGATLAGTVTVAEALKGQLPKQGTLYVFARPAQGSRMPVALLKKQVADLPLSFVLDDAAAMVPGVGLSGQKDVVVVARISVTGNVTPAPGDLQGVSAPIPVGQKGIKLEINEVLK